MSEVHQDTTKNDRRRLRAGLLKPELDYLNGQIADLTSQRDDLADQIAWLRESTPLSTSSQLRLLRI